MSLIIGAVWKLVAPYAPAKALALLLAAVVTVTGAYAWHRAVVAREVREAKLVVQAMLSHKINAAQQEATMKLAEKDRVIAGKDAERSSALAELNERLAAEANERWKVLSDAQAGDHYETGCYVDRSRLLSSSRLRAGAFRPSRGG